MGQAAAQEGGMIFVRSKLGPRSHPECATHVAGYSVRASDSPTLGATICVVYGKGRDAATASLFVDEDALRAVGQALIAEHERRREAKAGAA
jgi:hypothetical protein